MKALTLIELIVVLTILVAVGGISFAILDINQITLGPSQQSIPEVITQTNLQNLLKSIMGSDSSKGYYQDLGQVPSRMPQTLADLFRLPPTLPPNLQTYNPQLGLGWRGPYLLTPMGRYGIQNSSGSFEFRPGFDSSYGNPEDPALLDAWGNPIVLQIQQDGVLGISEEEATYARMVSAGPNGILETPTGAGNLKPGSDSLTELTLSECGDDLVLFLQVSDTRE